MHWRSVRPEMVTTGTNRFPHFGQCVVRSMRSSRFFLPMAHWFHGGAGPNSPFSFHRNLRGEVCFGAIQASVTALSITCRWTLLHSGQVNVRKSWPNVLGSIAVSLIGDPQAVHCGPWFLQVSLLSADFRPRANDSAGRRSVINRDVRRYVLLQLPDISGSDSDSIDAQSLIVRPSQDCHRTTWVRRTPSNPGRSCRRSSTAEPGPRDRLLGGRHRLLSPRRER